MAFRLIKVVYVSAHSPDVVPCVPFLCRSRAPIHDGDSCFISSFTLRALLGALSMHVCSYPYVPLLSLAFRQRCLRSVNAMSIRSRDAFPDVPYIPCNSLPHEDATSFHFSRLYCERVLELLSFCIHSSNAMVSVCSSIPMTAYLTLSLKSHLLIPTKLKTHKTRCLVSKPCHIAKSLTCVQQVCSTSFCTTHTSSTVYQITPS